MVTWEEVENALRICAESYRKERKIVEMEQSSREEALFKVKESELWREEIRKISSEVLRERGAWTGGYDMRRRFGNGNYVRFQKVCHGCGVLGHSIRFCPKSDRREIKNELPHRDVRVYNLFLKEQDAKRMKIGSGIESEKSSSLISHRGVSSVGKWTKEKFMKMFSAVLNVGNGEMKFTRKIKCPIKTEESKIIIRKGQVVPQSLKRKAQEYFNELEKKIIRKTELV